MHYQKDMHSKRNTCAAKLPAFFVLSIPLGTRENFWCLHDERPLELFRAERNLHKIKQISTKNHLDI